MEIKKEKLEDKWGKSSLTMGWVAIPTSLLFLQSELSISPLGMNIILNLVSHWWSSEDHPYPSQESLAKRIGVSKRSVQREMANLITLGIIIKTTTKVADRRYKGRNIYDLSPLVDVLNNKSVPLKKKLNKKN
ncbi:helix-turn-helix domain-containing protein [Morganella morganii]